MKKNGAEEAAKRNENEDEKAVREERRNWLFLSLRVQPWIGSDSGTNSRLRFTNSITQVLL